MIFVRLVRQCALLDAGARRQRLVASKRRPDAGSNGLEAVAALDRQPYDVVLMDVQMPELDGRAAPRRIRALGATHDEWRIVAMTANAMQGDRELCMEAGMDDDVTKPIRVERLVEPLAAVPARAEPSA